MKNLPFIVTLIGYFCLTSHAHPENYEISLGIRDSSYVEAKMRKDFPLAFRIKNLQMKPIAGEKLPRMFYNGTVHLASDSSVRTTRVSTRWRTAVYDVSMNQTFECPNYGDLFDYFPGTEDGNYSVWWTLGELKSNSLHFSIANKKITHIKQ